MRLLPCNKISSGIAIILLILLGSTLSSNAERITIRSTTQGKSFEVEYRLINGKKFIKLDDITDFLSLSYEKYPFSNRVHLSGENIRIVILPNETIAISGQDVIHLPDPFVLIDGNLYVTMDTMKRITQSSPRQYKLDYLKQNQEPNMNEKVPPHGLEPGDKFFREPTAGVRVIAIDAGHSHTNPGILAADGSRENEINYQLAILLKEVLVNRYGFLVELIGEKDNELNQLQRIEAANRLKADVYISIHQAFRCPQSRNLYIYYYQDETGRSQDLSPWEQSSLEYKESSRLLAYSIAEALEYSELSRETKVQGRQLIILEGLAMPGVVVELLCLNQPDDLKLIKDKTKLQHLAEILANGIYSFRKDFEELMRVQDR